MLKLILIVVMVGCGGIVRLLYFSVFCFILKRRHLMIYYNLLSLFKKIKLKKIVPIQHQFLFFKSGLMD